MKNLADKHKVFIHTHRSCSLAEFNAELQITGHRPVAHLHDIGFLDSNVLLYHMVAVNDEEIDLLKEHDVKVAHCPNFFTCKGVKHKWGNLQKCLEPD